MQDDDSRSRLCLVGLIGGTTISHELPTHGTIVIGRAPEADVRIGHASISRRHATLHLGPPVQIEDLNSANGTRVREQPIAAGERIDLQVGESFRVGAITLVLMTRHETPQIRAFWTHGYFEARVAEECARAASTGEGFAILRVHVETDATDVVKSALSSVLGSADVAGVYAPTEYEALLIPAKDREPKTVATRVVEVLAESELEAKAGLALYPQDGRDPYALLAKASAVARSEQQVAIPPSSHDHTGARMKEVLTLCNQVAKGEINVLVLGETGVGKEVFSERIHRQSPRADKPLLKLNCATLSETLLESELFGYERGAFTGADRMKQGLLETAEGGTVFLDEVGELPLGLQARLLRVIDDRKLFRVGGLKPISIDVRFVAATNRDLEVEAAAGRFRQDLYYRLNGVSLYIPPLRERRDEIESLVRLFVANASKSAKPPAVSPEALDLLLSYPWPGNIRELRNVAERAVLLCQGAPIRPEHLPVEKMRAMVTSTARKRPTAPPPVVRDDDTAVSHPAAPPRAGASLRDELGELERVRIENALRDCGGNQSAAAKMLGIPRPTLLKRLDAYGITRPRKR